MKNSLRDHIATFREVAFRHLAVSGGDQAIFVVLQFLRHGSLEVLVFLGGGAP